MIVCYRIPHALRRRAPGRAPRRTPWRTLLVCCFVTWLSGCTAHKQYRTEYTRCTGDAQACERHALHEVEHAAGPSYLLGIIEFDDQGQLWDRAQMHAVIGAIEEEAATRELLIVTFIHGWKHDAAPGDPNLLTFRDVLAQLSAASAELARRGDTPRRVVGVYLGWRGDSISVPLVKELTFWSRKSTAQKIGHGAVTEVLSRLEVVKATKNRMEQDEDTKLVVVGHSFGGAVAYTALAQVLANRFAHTTGPVGVQSTVAGFGDLVVLINPAFEAMLFASLSDMSTERGSYFFEQLPVLAVLTSEADDATRLAFPIGRWFSTLFERTQELSRTNAVTRAVETVSGARANRTAIGHFEPYRTHRLRIADNAGPAGAAAAGPRGMADRVESATDQWLNDQPGHTIRFGDLLLERTATSAGRNPYLVVRVDEEIIRDHNDVANPRLREFVEQLILVSTQSRGRLDAALEKGGLR